MNMYVGSPKPPPRTNLLPRPLSFQHHSLTLPAMSVVPKPLTAPSPPTGTVPAPEKLLFGMMSRLASACAARFQWKTVGRLLPENAAYAAASYQLTPATGCFSNPFGKLPSSQVDGPGRPVPSRKTAIASCHGTARPLLRNGSFQSSRFS